MLFASSWKQEKSRLLKSEFEQKIMVFEIVRNLSSSVECLDGVRYHILVLYEIIRL